MDTYRPPLYLMGLDLGKKRDWTALAVLKQTPIPTGQIIPSEQGFSLRYGQQVASVPAIENRYDLVHLDRWRDRSYRAVVPEVERVKRQLHQVAMREEFEATGIGQLQALRQDLLVDQTGVGIAVVDDIRAAGLDCYGITIHGGDSVHRDGRDIRVPKRELVGQLQVLLQSRRLGIPGAEALPLAEALVEELDNFRAKTSLATGHDTYGAGEDWRERNHDDLVLAVAMAVWFGEYRAGKRPRIRKPTGRLATHLSHQ